MLMCALFVKIISTVRFYMSLREIVLNLLQLSATYECGTDFTHPYTVQLPGQIGGDTGFGLCWRRLRGSQLHCLPTVSAAVCVCVCTCQSMFICICVCTGKCMKKGLKICRQMSQKIAELSLMLHRIILFTRGNHGNWKSKNWGLQRI